VAQDIILQLLNPRVPGNNLNNEYLLTIFDL